MGFTSRGHTQLKMQQSMTLTEGIPNTFPNAWKFGNGWHTLFLNIDCSLTNSGGSAPVTDGIYRFIKAITLTLSDGRTLIKGVPGLFWLHHNTYTQAVAPKYTTFAATTAHYYANLAIPFSTPQNLALRGADTVLDTRKLNNATLTLSVGTLVDCMTIGSSTATWTATATIEQTAGTWNGPQPLQSVEFKVLPSLALASSTIMQVDKTDLAVIRRLWLYVVNSGTATPYAGTASDNTIKSLVFRTSYDQEFDAVGINTLQAVNTRQYNVANLTGVIVLDLVQDKSLYSAMPSGIPLSQLEFTTDTLSTSYVHGVMENLTMAQK